MCVFYNIIHHFDKESKSLLQILKMTILKDKKCARYLKDLLYIKFICCIHASFFF